jgi:hypothetical protein
MMTNFLDQKMEGIEQSLQTIVKLADATTRRGRFVYDFCHYPATLEVLREFLDMISKIAPEHLSNTVKSAFGLYFQEVTFDHHNRSNEVERSKEAVKFFMTDLQLPFEHLLKDDMRLLKSLMKTPHVYALIELFRYGLSRDHVEAVLHDYLRDILSISDEVFIRNSYSATVHFLLSLEDPEKWWGLGLSKELVDEPLLRLPVRDGSIAKRLKAVYPDLKFDSSPPVPLPRSELFNGGSCHFPECSQEATVAWSCRHGVCDEHHRDLLEHRRTERCVACRSHSCLAEVND